MGCCATREEKFLERQLRPNKKKVRRPLDIKLIMSQGSSVDNPDAANFEENRKDLKESNIVSKLVELRSNGRWAEICKYVQNSYPTSFNPEILKYKWASTPKTVGCLALAMIAEAACEDPSIALYLSKSMPNFLVSTLKMGIKDYKDFALLLLYYSIDEYNESVISKLVYKDIFQSLVVMMSSSERYVRLLACAIAAKIYRNREKPQRIFMKLRGLEILVRLVKKHAQSDEDIFIILGSILDLSYVKFI